MGFRTGLTPEGETVSITNPANLPSGTEAPDGRLLDCISGMSVLENPEEMLAVQLFAK